VEGGELGVLAEATPSKAGNTAASLSSALVSVWTGSALIVAAVAGVGNGGVGGIGGGEMG
jgi:hypothetical protein